MKLATQGMTQFLVMAVLCLASQPTFIFSSTLPVQETALAVQDSAEQGKSADVQKPKPAKKAADRGAGFPSASGITALQLAANLKAIDKGLDYLVARMKTGDGSFSNRYPVAVTALGGMAMLGAGVEFNRGPRGLYLGRAVEFLLDSRRRTDRGFIHDDGSTASKMHGHAYAILFLAQIVGAVPGQSKNLEIQKVVKAGLKVIMESQTPDGGWGYRPLPSVPDEASITVCCLQALRAGQDAGFKVDALVINKALSYLKSCSKPDGSFRYSLRGASRSSYELTAAAVSTLNAAGQYTGKVHHEGLKYLKLALARRTEKPLHAASKYLFYGNLYASQCYWQSGGKLWSDWAASAYPQIIKMQNRAEGSWQSTNFGKAYATSVALLILEIPLGYLPIFER